MYVIPKSFIVGLMTTLTGSVLLFVLPLMLYAYFSDEGTITKRGSFSTGEIKATLEADTVGQYLSVNASSSTVILNTSDTSTIATQSRLTFSPQSCDTGFYNTLLLEVTADGSTRAGTFADVEVSGVGVPSRYQLEVELSPNVTPAEGESCGILATLETWQTEFPDPTNGFSDVETTLITFTTPETVEQQATPTPVIDTVVDA